MESRRKRVLSDISTTYIFFLGKIITYYIYRGYVLCSVRLIHKYNNCYQFSWTSCSWFSYNFIHKLIWKESLIWHLILRVSWSLHLTSGWFRESSEGDFAASEGFTALIIQRCLVKKANKELWSETFNDGYGSCKKYFDINQIICRPTKVINTSYDLKLERTFYLYMKDG